MRRLILNVFLLLVAAQLSACATGNCRQLGQSEPAKAPAETAPAATPSGSGGGAAVTSKSPAQSKSTAAQKTVVIYKYDGSLQCGMGKAIPLAEMEKQLEGIKVLARENKPDGLMHIQVCGQPTGMVNAYTIPAASLKEAEKRGFRKWNFEE